MTSQSQTTTTKPSTVPTKEATDDLQYYKDLLTTELLALELKLDAYEERKDWSTLIDDKKEKPVFLYASNDAQLEIGMSKTYKLPSIATPELHIAKEKDGSLVIFKKTRDMNKKLQFKKLEVTSDEYQKALVAVGKLLEQYLNEQIILKKTEGIVEELMKFFKGESKSEDQLKWAVRTLILQKKLPLFEETYQSILSKIKNKEKFFNNQTGDDFVGGLVISNTLSVNHVLKAIFGIQKLSPSLFNFDVFNQVNKKITSMLDKKKDIIANLRRFLTLIKATMGEKITLTTEQQLNQLMDFACSETDSQKYLSSKNKLALLNGLDEAKKSRFDIIPTSSSVSSTTTPTTTTSSTTTATTTTAPVSSSGSGSMSAIVTSTSSEAGAVASETSASTTTTTTTPTPVSSSSSDPTADPVASTSSKSSTVVSETLAKSDSKENLPKSAAFSHFSPSDLSDTTQSSTQMAPPASTQVKQGAVDRFFNFFRAKKKESLEEQAYHIPVSKGGIN